LRVWIAGTTPTTSVANKQTPALNASTRPSISPGRCIVTPPRGEEQSDGSSAQQAARRPRQTLKHQALRNELFHETPATRAYSHPNRHFMSSRERPHQQQIADVRARNQQDKHDHDEHDFERGK
jgi:hypothetical protein